ncbi:MAG: hypothetical protein IPK08_22335 [Bacteroidetes bacterium]|nr:hypothetical protein [Bacteroidota bacterium]
MRQYNFNQSSILQASVNVVTALGPLTFCKGDSVVLTATPGMLNYQWYRWNNAIAGATSAYFTAKAEENINALHRIP